MFQELFQRFEGFDEPGDSSGRGMVALLADLGIEDPDDYDLWVARVMAAARAGVPALLERLGHPDPEVRRMVTHVLEWRAEEAPTVVNALKERLDREPDAPTRLGIVLAIGRLDPDRAWLDAEKTNADPVRRWAAAFAEAQFLGGSPIEVLADDVMAGGDAYVQFWGPEWHTGIGAAVRMLRGRPDDQIALLRRTAGRPEQPWGFLHEVSGVLSRVRHDDELARVLGRSRTMPAP